MAAEDYTRFFPYESPYENQREAMDRIANALSGGQHVLFEGACGTGKTLSALAPALECARREDKTVAITTNVHQQTRQFIAEARAITETESIRAVVFRGKSSMCHVDVGYEECQALRDTTYDLAELERERDQLERRAEDLLDAARDGDEEAAAARSDLMSELDALEADIEGLEDAATCAHYRKNLVGDTDPFYSWLYDGVRTPDEIYARAEEAGFCGYELLKDGVEGVDLVVCNYHHLLDPTIRAQFFRWLGRDPEDVIAVFDEAHNLESAAREHASRTLSERTLEGALDELDDTDDARARHAENVVAAFREALAEVREDADVTPGDDWTDVTVANEDRRDDLTLSFLRRYAGHGIETDVEQALSLASELDEEYERAYKRGETDTRKECQTKQAAEFVAAYLDDGTELGTYPVAGVRRDEGTGEAYARAELYTCIPREVTADLLESVHAGVLMSATLRPFDVLGEVLGVEDAVEMAYGLTFPPERRRTFAVDAPPLFASERDDPDVQETVTGVLADLVRFTPGNTLLFFPSYAEADRYRDRLAGEVSADTTLYLDEAGTRADDVRESFVEDDGAALLTSLWGTLTEGVSFDGDAAHTVGVVGVPYPRLDDRTDAVQDAYDEAFGEDGAGWRYAVEIPTVRKTRQALGRVLRSPEEVGVRALVDRRYTETAAREMPKYSVRGAFPPEEREELVDVAPSKLKFAMLNFYGDHDAYDGNPPSP